LAPNKPKPLRTLQAMIKVPETALWGMWELYFKPKLSVSNFSKLSVSNFSND